MSAPPWSFFWICTLPEYQMTHYWLVVWLPFFVFPYIGLLIITIDVQIFQRGGPTTNQTSYTVVAMVQKTMWQSIGETYLGTQLTNGRTPELASSCFDIWKPHKKKPAFLSKLNVRLSATLPCFARMLNLSCVKTVNPPWVFLAAELPLATDRSEREVVTCDITTQETDQVQEWWQNRWPSCSTIQPIHWRCFRARYKKGSTTLDVVWYWNRTSRPRTSRARNFSGMILADRWDHQSKSSTETQRNTYNTFEDLAVKCGESAFESGEMCDVYGCLTLWNRASLCRCSLASEKWDEWRVLRASWRSAVHQPCYQATRSSP